MPELPEVEAYRRLAEGTLGREVAHVKVGDRRFLRAGTTAPALRDALAGQRFDAARRRGKLLVLDVEGSGRRLGLRFGMTGRLSVDGRAAIEHLLFAPERDIPAWNRFSLRFADGGELVVSDPRLFGGVVLDPDEESLGPDALAITAAELRHALADGTVALKARLLDQARVAGIGNLVADEVLWRAGLSPLRPAGSLTSAEMRRLHRHLRTTLEELVARGGSHLGELVPERHPGGLCRRDGAELRRQTIGGRTTWWCPVHQH